ncbi:transposable element Tcb2 transposase [Trichonephila clavipes]|nr:transposable element Tcb2 transposase [Trichonephila clavipes]
MPTIFVHVNGTVFSKEESSALPPSDNSYELVPGVSRIRVLVPLKVNRAQEADTVKYVEAQCPPVDVGWYLEEECQFMCLPRHLTEAHNYESKRLSFTNIKRLRWSSGQLLVTVIVELHVHTLVLLKIFLVKELLHVQFVEVQSSSIGVVRKFGEGVPAQVSFSSRDSNSKAGRHAVLLARWIVRSVPLEIVGRDTHAWKTGSGETRKTTRRDHALPLTPEHRQLRLQWCQARSMCNVTNWQKVVFSDESRFILGTDDNRVRVWRRPGERYNSLHTVLRHTACTAGLMVWGAIAYDSRSTLIVMCGTLTSQRYVDDILRPYVGPFLNGLPGAIFQQDNARPHTARVAQDFLRHFQTLPWQACSPDLSPVEHVWDQLKRQMPSCHSVHDLELAV